MTPCSSRARQGFQVIEKTISNSANKCPFYALTRGHLWNKFEVVNQHGLASQDGRISIGF